MIAGLRTAFRSVASQWVPLALPVLLGCILLQTLLLLPADAAESLADFGELSRTEPVAHATEASGPERVVYEFGRLREFDNERLAFTLAAAAAIVLAALVWYLYRRDTVEMRRPIGVGLALLRFVVLAALFVFFLSIERRTSREVVHNSQVAVLVDVSQSMALPNEKHGDAASAAELSRLGAVVDVLHQSPLVADLRRVHDLNVARFDADKEPVISLPKVEDVHSRPILGRSSDVRSDDDKPRRSESGQDGPARSTSVDWSTELQPRGIETRLGQALADELALYRNTDKPLAAIVVVSDGAQNAGVEPSAAVEAAKAAKVPIFTIGVGSTEPQRNVALTDLVVPARAFPGDTFNVTGYVQAAGYAGRLMEAELLRRRAGEPAGSGAPVASDRIVIGADGEIVPVTFDLEPDEPGTFVYQLRVVPPRDDGNARDNQREAEVDVVDRQTRVLLFASGPMRDYQFLRDQLQRDKSMVVDVLLQTAQAGMSQDANEILQRFPSTREDLYKYDCIVAFDPDWTQLEPDEVELLESWVSEEAGGLISVAGPIHTGKWVRSAELAKLRNLYPVVFQKRAGLLDDGHYSGETPWPLEFERAGREARFLWLDTSAADSAAAWENFPGVYGYFAVKGEKPGATVYARFSDPEAGLANRPVYLAGQFYGAGQVFYLGSGEMWRLRSTDPAYFEVLYTKLIRQASQGRILRGSARGSLLVERDRFELGETVVVRARLSDAQHNPLQEPTVAAQVLRPDGATEPVKLVADEDQPGMYVGQIAVLTEGTYQLSLPIPDSSEEPLMKYLQVRVPDLERAHAERNEKLLASLASETGGVYYPRLEGAVSGDGDLPRLADAIQSRAEVRTIKGAPDKQFAQLQMQWLLGIIAGSLFLEWIVRRLNRLA